MAHCWPLTLTNQAIMRWSRELHDMARVLEWLCHQYCLGPRLPRGHCGLSPGCRPAQAPAPSPMKPLPPSLLTPAIPFCLLCFGAYVHNGLPCSSPLEGGCGCYVARARFAGHAQCEYGP